MKRQAELVNSYRILYVINSLDHTSIPLDWAIMLYERGWDIAVLPVEPWRNQIQPEDIDIPVIEINNYRRGDPRAIWELRQKIRRHNTRLLHAHGNYPSGIASLAILTCSHVYMVNTEHALHEGSGRFGLLCDYIGLYRGDYHCFNSIATMNSLGRWAQRLIRGSHTKVIYNGVPIQEIRAMEWSREDTCRRWGLSNDSFLIGNIATLKRHKDHGTLLRAIKLLAREYPQVKLLLVGDGQLRDMLEDQVNRLGITNHVYFMGTLKREEVYQLLYALDVSVMASRWEGFCNAIVESMAARLPVLVSDIPTFKEVVGNAGMYFRTGDPENLAEKLEQLIVDESIRSKYASLAQSRCFELYSVEKAIENYEEVYRSLLCDQSSVDRTQVRQLWRSK